MAHTDNNAAIPATMSAMLLTGHGDVDVLQYRQDVPTPQPGPGQVLVQVTATAKNNTDRKAREGLYPTKGKEDVTSFAMGGSPTLTFPRIQGADVAGRIVAVGEGVDAQRIGERGLLDFNLYADERRDINLTPDYYGHGADGGYAEYAAVPADQFHHVANPELHDAELAAMGMCSYQTAYHMMTAANVHAGERVLVSGASGGVGTALIQLCRIVGAIPYAVSQLDKADALISLGAEAVIGEVDNGLPLIETVTDEAIAAICAEACGAMKVAHAMTVEYSRQRKQFGVPIGKFQVLQHRMVDMISELERATSMAILAASLADDADSAERSAKLAAAKFIVNRAGRYVAEQCIQLHGGIAMTWEYNGAHYAKRLVMISHQFGDDDHHLEAYAAQLGAA